MRVRYVRTCLAAVILGSWSPPGLAGTDEITDGEAHHKLKSNIGLVSDYVSRGLSETWGKPAIQASAEFEHTSGWYLGVWGSNVSTNLYPGGSLELELTAGYEQEAIANVSVAGELTYYLFPGANFSKGICQWTRACPSQSFNTLEGRFLLRWKWLTAASSLAITDYFGDAVSSGYQGSSRGTTYWELDANPRLPVSEGWSLISHIGYTRYTTRLAAPRFVNGVDPSYWDWKLGVSKAFRGNAKGWSVNLYYTQASNSDVYGDVASLANAQTRDLGGPTLILSVFKQF